MEYKYFPWKAPFSKIMGYTKWPELYGKKMELIHRCINGKSAIVRFEHGLEVISWQAWRFAKKKPIKGGLQEWTKN